MDDLQSAILLSLQPTTDNALRLQAHNYCQSIRSSPQGLAIILQCLSVPNLRPETIFWCLNTLNDLLSTITATPSSNNAPAAAAAAANAQASQQHQHVQHIRPAVLNFLSQLVYAPPNSPARNLNLPYLLNKLAQVFVSLIAIDYPHNWPTAFRAHVLPLATPVNDPDNHSQPASPSTTPSASTSAARNNAAPSSAPSSAKLAAAGAIASAASTDQNNKNSTQRQQQHRNVTPESVAMFFRILRVLDDDVTSIRAAQLSDVKRTTSIRVKDALRDDCIVELVARCAHLMTAPSLAPYAFDVIARYVEWIDIGLVIRDDIVPPMYAAITAGLGATCEARGAAASALKCVILKRMDPEVKIQLLQALKVDAFLQAIPVDAVLADDDPNNASIELHLRSGQIEVASLVNAIAMTGLDIIKAVAKEQGKNASVAPNVATTAAAATGLNNVANGLAVAREYASGVVQVALPLAMRFLSDDEEGACRDTLQCVSTFVNVFGQTAKNGASQGAIPDMQVVVAILRMIEERAVLPSDFDPGDEQPGTERLYPEQRQMLVKTIFSSVARSFPDATVEFVTSLFGKGLQKGDVLQMELALALVINLSSLGSEKPEITELRRNVIANPPPCMSLSAEQAGIANNPTQQHQLELVSKSYFDLVSRSARLFLVKGGDPALLTGVLQVFFDERGLGHRWSESVRAHAAYSLVKLAKPLRGVITSTHLETVLNAGTRELFPVNTEQEGQTFKKQMLMFETIGYMLGTDHKREGSVRYLLMLMQPVIEGLAAAQTGNGASAYIAALGFLSKGFGGDSKPILLPTKESGSRGNGGAGRGMGSSPASVSASPADMREPKDVTVHKVTPVGDEVRAVWTQAVEAVLKKWATALANKNGQTDNMMRERLMFFLHRMVDTIGASMGVYLEQVLGQLVAAAVQPMSPNNSGNNNNNNNSISNSNASDGSVVRTDDIRDIMTLSSQCAIKLGEAFGPACRRVYAPIVEHVVNLRFNVNTTHTTSATGVTAVVVSEADREALDAHRALIYLINVLVNGPLLPILVDQRHIHLLHPVTETVLRHAVGADVDIRAAASIMRMALHTLALMIDRWCGADAHIAPPGFAKFALDKIAVASVACALRGVIFNHNVSNNTTVAARTAAAGAGGGGGNNNANNSNNSAAAGPTGAPAFTVGDPAAVLAEVVTLHRVGVARLGDAFIAAVTAAGLHVVPEAPRRAYFDSLMPKTRKIGTGTMTTTPSPLSQPSTSHVPVLAQLCSVMRSQLGQQPQQQHDLQQQQTQQQQPQQPQRQQQVPQQQLYSQLVQQR